VEIAIADKSAAWAVYAAKVTHRAKTGIHRMRNLIGIITAAGRGGCEEQRLMRGDNGEGAVAVAANREEHAATGNGRSGLLILGNGVDGNAVDLLNDVALLEGAGGGTAIINAGDHDAMSVWREVLGVIGRNLEDMDTGEEGGIGAGYGRWRSGRGRRGGNRAGLGLGIRGLVLRLLDDLGGHG